MSLNKSHFAVKKQLFSERKINFLKPNSDSIMKLEINIMFLDVFYSIGLPSHVTVDGIELRI